MIDFMPKPKNLRNKAVTRVIPSRVGSPLNVWINTELMEAFESYCRQTRRTKTAEIELAMEEKLRSVGLWPPKINE